MPTSLLDKQLVLCVNISILHEVFPNWDELNPRPKAHVKRERACSFLLLVSFYNCSEPYKLRVFSRNSILNWVLDSIFSQKVSLQFKKMLFELNLLCVEITSQLETQQLRKNGEVWFSRQAPPGSYPMYGGGRGRAATAEPPAIQLNSIFFAKMGLLKIPEKNPLLQCIMMSC